MKVFKFLLLLVVTFLVYGCALPLTLMSRNSGKVYHGTANPDGFGGGHITLNVDGVIYTGPMSRTSSGQTYGFFQTYGGRNVSTSSFSSFGGTNYGKAILSTGDGRGMRCDLQGDGAGHGSLICVDDTGRVLDGVVGQ